MIGRMYSFARKIWKRDLPFPQEWSFDNAVKFVKNIRDDVSIMKRQYKSRFALNRMYRKISRTPRFICNPSARAEIHTLTAHHHVFMYITAIKSFLRYHGDIAVVAHDDGSLTDDDKSILKAHIEGIRIIDRKVADAQMDAVLADFPHSRTLRQRIVNSMELFDNILLSKTDKVVNMNSDVLFFKEPRELVDWVGGDNKTIEGVYEEQPAEQREFLIEHSCPFPPHVTTALTCFYKDVLDLELVESVLESVRCTWFTAQNIYPILFHNKTNDYKIRFFDKNRFQASGEFESEAVFRHYWTSTGLFTDLQYDDSKKVIGELARGMRSFPDPPRGMEYPLGSNKRGMA